MPEPCPNMIVFARHAIFAKDGAFGQIALACTSQINQITCDDPRTKGRVTKTFETRDLAKHWFEEYVIATVTENGWKLIYNGARNFG